MLVSIHFKHISKTIEVIMKLHIKVLKFSLSGSKTHSSTFNISLNYNTFNLLI